VDLCDSEHRPEMRGFFDWLKVYQFLNMNNIIYIYVCVCDAHKLVIRLFIFVYINPLNCGATDILWVEAGDV
jgi:hypothetical protein